MLNLLPITRTLKRNSAVKSITSFTNNIFFLFSECKKQHNILPSSRDSVKYKKIEKIDTNQMHAWQSPEILQCPLKILQKWLQQKSYYKLPMSK